MKRSHFVSWLPVALHLAHALVVFGLAYALTSLTILWHHAAPNSTESLLFGAAWIGGAILELALVVYLFLRKARIKRIWADATTATRSGDFATARALAAQLLAYWEYTLNPAPAYYAMAVASEGMGEGREAAVLYRRAGDYPPALLNLGVLLLERGANDRAAEALRRYMARTQQDLSSVVLLSMALYRSGKIEAAKGVLRKKLAERPASPLLKRNLERLDRGEEPALFEAVKGKPDLDSPPIAK